MTETFSFVLRPDRVLRPPLTDGHQPDGASFATASETEPEGLPEFGTLTALALDGARIGLPPGTELESAVLTFFTSRGLSVTIVPIETQGEAREAFYDGEIDSFLMHTATSDLFLPVEDPFIGPVLNNASALRLAPGTLSPETISVATVPRTYATERSDFVGLRDSVINEQVDGLDGDDRIGTGTGDDLVLGGAGNDTLVSADGDDTLIGGAGADRLHGGAGVDTASYATSVSRVVVALDGAAARAGDARGDQLFGIEVLIGSDHDDHLTGNDRDNTINGGEGYDRIFGLGGDDLILTTRPVEIEGTTPDIETQADTLFGGEGDDTLIPFGSTDDVLFGGAGDDEISGSNSDGDLRFHGGSGDDRIFGGTGDDVFYGGDGDDLMRGQAGSNLMFGGNGDDQMHSIGGSGAPDFNVDTLYGGQGDDRIIFFAGSGEGARLVGGSGDDTFHIERSHGSSIFGGTGDDVILFENLSVRDQDTATSFAHGGDGQDTLLSGAFDDDLAGGAGADTFGFIGFNGGFGTDIIRDFADGDTITFFDNSLTFDDLTVQSVGGGRATLITVETEHWTGSIRLNRVDAATIDADDFVFEPELLSELGFFVFF